MMLAQAYNALVERLRKEGTYSTSMLNCLNRIHKVGNDFEQKRVTIANDRHLSPLGQREKLAELAKGMVKDVLEAGRPGRGLMAQVVGQRQNMKPRPTATEDSRAELRRQEIRAFVRSQPEDKRIGVALQIATDDEALNALLDGHAMLSGLNSQQVTALQRVYAERHHSARLAELEGWENDAGVVQAGVDLVMSDLARASGMNDASFVAHVKAAQDEMDKGG